MCIRLKKCSGLHATKWKDLIGEGDMTSNITKYGST